MANTLQPDETLWAGDDRTSDNGLFSLLMQDDGNLVLSNTQDGFAVWASSTSYAGAYAVMQGDGNFVIYSDQTESRQSLWHSGTWDRWGANLSVGEDGRLVIFHSGEEIWATPAVAEAAVVEDITQQAQGLGNRESTENQTAGDSEEEEFVEEARILRTTGHITIIDDEGWFESPEVCEYDFEYEMSLDDDNPDDNHTFVWKCGGEIRIEMEVSAQLEDEGDIRADILGKLFEGDSDTSIDVDAQWSDKVLVRRNKRKRYQFDTANTGFGGGDKAVAQITFRNKPDE